MYRPKQFCAWHATSETEFHPSQTGADRGVVLPLPGCVRFVQTAAYLRSVRRQLGRDVSARLVSALVLSRLDYCNAVLAGLPAATLAPLQRVLNAAARLVLDLKPRDHATPVLRELHWLPIAQRIEYKLCLLVHKTFFGHTPDYISDLLTTVADIPTRSSLRASSNGNLFLQRTERRFRDRAFSLSLSRCTPVCGIGCRQN